MTADLISRLEAGPSREVDAEIWEHLGLVNERHCRDWCSMDGRTDLTREMFIKAWAPEYTKSIDAALSVMPDEPWNVGTYLGSFIASVGEQKHFGRTPAIAMMIAILRARENT